MCDCDAKNFTATATGDKAPRELTVSGYCTCPQTGYRLYLEFDNPGINPDPSVLVLRLVAEPPPIGGQALTRTEVEPLHTTIAAAVRLVLIRQAGGDDLAVPVVEQT